MTPVLVSAEWLLDNIDRVRVLDASSHLPTVKRDASAESCRPTSAWIASVVSPSNRESGTTRKRTRSRLSWTI